MKNKRTLAPWPIDGKCFVQDIVTDFAELLGLSGSVAFGNVGNTLNSVAFYTHTPDGSWDELVEMRWCADDNVVLIMCKRFKFAKYIAAKYKKWVEECEDTENNEFLYRCIIDENPERGYASVSLYKEVED